MLPCQQVPGLATKADLWPPLGLLGTCSHVETCSSLPQRWSWLSSKQERMFITVPAEVYCRENRTTWSVGQPALTVLTASVKVTAQTTRDGKPWDPELHNAKQTQQEWLTYIGHGTGN